MCLCVVRLTSMSQCNVVLPSLELKNFLPATCCHCLLSDPKDGSHVFPQNLAKLLSNHRASHPKKLFPTLQSLPWELHILQSYFAGNTKLNINNKVIFFVFHLNSTVITHLTTYRLQASWLIRNESGGVISININMYE